MSQPNPEDPRETPADASAAPPAGSAARREHSLLSLLELSRELKVSLDLHETADLLLFNLMGQLGTARSALWLLPDEGRPLPVMVRAHGFQRDKAQAAGARWSEALIERFDQNAAPVLTWALNKKLDTPAFDLLRQAEIALFAPLQARDELLGWIALGDRVDGSPYAPADLQVIEAARSMVSVSLLNARLFNRMRETNRQLLRANEHLHELDRLKTEFLSNVNHELRTPLAVILASLDLVVSQDSLDPKFGGLLRNSLQQARNLNHVIQNLLNFNDITEARLPIHVAPDHVDPMLEECMSERQPGVTAGLHELVLVAPYDLPPARFDRPRVRQILDELIDNAVKFTPRGSRIELRATPCRDEGSEWVRIDVSDNGPGIPHERLGTLFKSFEQVDGSSTRTAGGLGLGLAFAHQLAQRMNCRLGVESEAGEGTKFSLYLPVS